MCITLFNLAFLCKIGTATSIHRASDKHPIKRPFMYTQVLAVMAPVILIPGIGYIWSKTNQAFDTAAIGQLVMLLTAPCLILSTFSETQLNLPQLFSIGGIAVAVTLIMGGITWVCASALHKAPEPYMLCTMFPNLGNIGLPVCFFAFGDEGLAFALAYFLAGAFLHFSIGIMLISGQKWYTALMRSPIIYASVLAIAMLATDSHFPAWALNTISLIGQLSIPLMLLALGVSLAHLSIQQVPTNTGFALLRLGGGFGLSYVIASGFSFSPIAFSVILIQSSMPSAVFNYILALRYARAANNVAAIIVISTLISFITLPWLVHCLLLQHAA